MSLINVGFRDLSPTQESDYSSIDLLLSFFIWRLSQRELDENYNSKTLMKYSPQPL